jgi:hypothetical protein
VRSRFLSVAEVELADAIEYYQLEADLGERFLTVITKTLTALEKQPMIGRLVDSTLRSFPVPTFPFSLIYEIVNDEIVIVAVAHHRRSPRYWSTRTIG